MIVVGCRSRFRKNKDVFVFISYLSGNITYPDMEVKVLKIRL